MKRSTYIHIYIGILAIFAVSTYVFLQKNVPEHLRINEIAFLHDDGIDWIEIYNPTMNNLSLKGLYISDNASNVSKFKIEDDVIVPSRGFAVVYCKGYEGDTTNSTVTNFRVSNGETIYLVASNGSTIVDSMIAIAEENSDHEITIGRFPDGSDELFIMKEATKGAKNMKQMLQGAPPAIITEQRKKP